MNLMTLFDNQVQWHGEAPAISMSSTQTTWSYQTLNERVKSVANHFFEKGIRQGDGVLILTPMSLELYVTLLALFRLGAVAVFIDPQSSQAHIAACVKKYALKAFVGIQKAHLLRLKHKAIRQIPIQISVGFMPFSHNLNHFVDVPTNSHPIVSVKGSDPALITFTSGSTGAPKAAVRSHSFLLKQYEVLSKNMFFEKDSVDISTLPIFILANLAAGMHSVIPNVNLLKPSEVAEEVLLNDIIRYQAQRIGGSPALINKLVGAIGSLNDVEKAKIKLTHLYVGGGPVYPKDLHALKTVLPHTEVIGLYGSTEAEPISHASVEEYNQERIQQTNHARGLFVGKPITDIEVKIISSEHSQFHMDNFDSIECDTGKRGEIIVSGEHVLQGYLNQEGDSENKIHVKGKVWHRTGDAGYFDNDGNLWLLGRYSQRIHYQGIILYPFAIEACFYDKGFSTALVMHKKQPCLVVENADIDSNLLSYFGISKTISVQKIPRDKRHNTKVDYTALNQLISQL
jgi:olefin beta-lactone synthetase